ncbi:MAG: hypothetical protein QXF25_02820 [Candidatus Pacearchaeota archaeon]
MKKNIEKLKKNFLILSLVGIFILFIISKSTKPKQISICDIENLKKNIREKENIEIQGAITREKILSENFKLFILKNQSCEIEVICNCDTSNKNNLTFLNKEVLIIGKIQIYKNKTQIQAEKIIEKY